MEFREQGYEDDRFHSDVSQNLHCAICLNVFKDPVMCQRNEHCFCRPCIVRHLRNSLTCPTCKEELSPETLSRAPRILRDCLSELNIRCEYFDRGCREFVQLGDLETHVKNCGFSPVVCSNQGCLVEINKRDQTHHETEICEFRKVKCHDCVEVRKEIGEVKMNLTSLADETKINQIELGSAMQEMKMSQDEVNNAMQVVKRNQTELKNAMQEMKMNQTEVNREIQMNLREIMDKLATLTKEREERQRSRRESAKAKINVVIAGGDLHVKVLNTVENFCWSSKSWSPLKPMKECRRRASSFVFRNEIIVTGGWTGNAPTDTMERLNTSDLCMAFGVSFNFPAKLPAKLRGHSSVVYGERLIIVGGHDGNKLCDSIHEVVLVPPYTSKLLSTMPQSRWLHGAQLFGDEILICGGMKTVQSSDSVDSVIMYDIIKNKCKQMLPLPFAVYGMATVSWGDNVIVIGGADKDGKALNTVVIYNVKTEKSHMLPAMKYKRKGCAAVVVSNTIVVMGGRDERGTCLRSVEGFSFDRYSWEDLPSMNEARHWSVAVVR